MREIEILHHLILAHNKMTGETEFDKTYEELFEEVSEFFLDDPVTIEEITLGTIMQMAHMMEVEVSEEEAVNIGMDLLNDVYGPFGGEPEDLVRYCPFPAEVLAMYILEEKDKTSEMANIIVS